jgi:hypothetical protein
MPTDGISAINPAALSTMRLEHLTSSPSFHCCFKLSVIHSIIVSPSRVPASLVPFMMKNSSMYILQLEHLTSSPSFHCCFELSVIHFIIIPLLFNNNSIFNNSWTLLWLMEMNSQLNCNWLMWFNNGLKRYELYDQNFHWIISLNHCSLWRLHCLFLFLQHIILVVDHWQRIGFAVYIYLYCFYILYSFRVVSELWGVVIVVSMKWQWGKWKYCRRTDKWSFKICGGKNVSCQQHN